MAHLFMKGRLRLGLYQNFYPYESAPNESKVTTFGQKVAQAIIQIRNLKAGEEVVQTFQKLSIMVDIVPTVGGGGFFPIHDAAKDWYGIEPGSYSKFATINSQVAGVIVWDPGASFKTNHTGAKDGVVGDETTLPPYVILCHEMGHCIQLDESGGKKSAQNWHINYGQKMAEVEKDNISRHESPLAVELGLTPRTWY